MLLIFTFVFSCRGFSLGQMGPMAHPGSHAGMSMPPVHASCCAINDAAGSAFLHAQFQAAVPVLILLLLIVFVFSVFPARLVLLRSASPPYPGRIRTRGSTRAFVYYVRLFSQGILHPKTF